MYAVIEKKLKWRVIDLVDSIDAAKRIVSDVPTSRPARERSWVDVESLDEDVEQGDFATRIQTHLEEATKKASGYREHTVLPPFTRARWVAGVLENPDDPFKWSGENDPPAIGAKVHIYMNDFGAGVVKAYFIENGWLGVVVQPDVLPQWFRKQNKGVTTAQLHFFGVDLEPRANKEA